MAHAISAEGLALVKSFEGFLAEPMALPGGDWVVGHGHVRVGAPGESVSAAQAADLLAQDLAPFESLVNGAAAQALSQSQFDALVSFAFSVGEKAFKRSQVLRRVNSGNYVAAACALDAWRKADVKGALEIVGALVARRTAEKALFLRDVACAPAPSALMRAKLDHAASVLGAPIDYAKAPQAEAPAPAKLDPKARLIEILKSEPATEALVLTQIAPPEAEAEIEEITTAHAKPVPRARAEEGAAPAPGLAAMLLAALGLTQAPSRRTAKI